MSHDESLALAKLSTPFPLSTGCSVCLSMCKSVTGKMGFSFKALDLCVYVCVCVCVCVSNSVVNTQTAMNYARKENNRHFKSCN